MAPFLQLSKLYVDHKDIHRLKAFNTKPCSSRAEVGSFTEGCFSHEGWEICFLIVGTCMPRHLQPAAGPLQQNNATLSSTFAGVLSHGSQLFLGTGWAEFPHVADMVMLVLFWNLSVFFSLHGTVLFFMPQQIPDTRPHFWRLSFQGCESTMPLSLESLLPASAVVTKAYKKALGQICKDFSKTSSIRCRWLGLEPWDHS